MEYICGITLQWGDNAPNRHPMLADINPNVSELFANWVR